jgi:hypothetical protein
MSEVGIKVKADILGRYLFPTSGIFQSLKKEKKRKKRNKLRNETKRKKKSKGPRNETKRNEKI